MSEPKKKRALVVDDDEPIRNMLTRIVARLDLQVDSARDGSEAIERLDSQKYDVVLLDLMMPHVDGYAVLRHMNQFQRDLLGCTIIASAVPMPEILAKFETPVFKVHAKPFDISALMADIRECTGQS